MTVPTQADLLVKESDFQEWLIGLAHYYRWRIAHFRPARTEKGWRTAVSGDGKGFPDCVLVRPPRLIIAELKSLTGKLSPEQEVWIRDLGECVRQITLEPVKFSKPRAYNKLIHSLEVYTWRPSDRDLIEDLLK